MTLASNSELCDQLGDDCIAPFLSIKDESTKESGRVINAFANILHPDSQAQK